MSYIAARSYVASETKFSITGVILPDSFCKSYLYSQITDILPVIMSNTLIAFFLGAGVFAWVYNKFYTRTGGNQQTSIPAALVVGVIAFLIMLTVMDRIS